MKHKISITLSEGVVAEMAKHERGFANRSAFVEEAVRAYVSELSARRRDARDRAILDRLGHRLNREAEDALEYQDNS